MVGKLRAARGNPAIEWDDCHVDGCERLQLAKLYFNADTDGGRFGGLRGLMEVWGGHKAIAVFGVFGSFLVSAPWHIDFWRPQGKGRVKAQVPCIRHVQGMARGRKRIQDRKGTVWEKSA